LPLPTLPIFFLHILIRQILSLLELSLEKVLYLVGRRGIILFFSSRFGT
jgi:hypothetical protein